MKRPRLNLLRTFEAAGRHLSFTQAADELNISQAAVSQQIRNLESYLDCRLFIRQNRRLSLTSNGQAYLDVVREALDRLDTVTDQLFPGQRGNSVTLRCTSAIATLWLAPHLKSLQQSHADIELRINTLDQFADNENTSQAELEIFISVNKPIDDRSLKLLSSTITPVCSPTLYANRRAPQKPIDLLNFELIHVLGYDDDWHRWLHRHHEKKVTVPGGLTVDGSLIAIEAALRGEGVMLGRRPFIDRYLESGELIEIFTIPYHLCSDYYLRQLPKNRTRREHQIVANWLQQLAMQPRGRTDV